MRTTALSQMDAGTIGRLWRAAIVVMLLNATGAALADNVQTSQAALLDRVQIEDLLMKYYTDLGAGDHSSLASYFTEDGVLDVNGTLFEGRKAIEAIYSRSGQGGRQSDESGKFHMLLSNVRIRVNGNTATADCVWTGTTNDNVRVQPRFVEQGRESDELVKRDGKWVIRKRMITSDGGMPDAFAKNYKRR